MPEACPVCGSVHDTYTAVAMHMCKTDDDSHPWDTQNEALEHLANEGLIGVGSSGEGSVVDTSDDTGADTSTADTSEPAEPTAADGGNPLVGDADPEPVEEPGDSEADCCNDPTLAGSRGMLVIGANHDADRLAGQVRKQPIQLDTVDLDAPMKLEDGDRVCMNCDEIHEGVSN